MGWGILGDSSLQLSHFFPTRADTRAEIPAIKPTPRPATILKLMKRASRGVENFSQFMQNSEMFMRIALFLRDTSLTAEQLAASNTPKG